MLQWEGFFKLTFEFDDKIMGCHPLPETSSAEAELLQGVICFWSWYKKHERHFFLWIDNLATVREDRKGLKK